MTAEDIVNTEVLQAPEDAQMSGVRSSDAGARAVQRVRLNELAKEGRSQYGERGSAFPPLCACKVQQRTGKQRTEMSWLPLLALESQHLTDFRC